MEYPRLTEQDGVMKAAPHVGTCALCGCNTNPTKPPLGSVGIVGKAASAQLAGRVCRDCFSAAIYGEELANDGLCDARVRHLFPRLAAALGRVPMTNWREQAFGQHQYVQDRLLELVTVAYSVPTVPEVNRLYGSWLQALVVSGLIDDALPSARGMRSIANDGHPCASEGERLIDDWLSANRVPHSREPEYPGTNYRGDFKVGDKIIEYFGLAGNADYDLRAEAKKEAAKKAGLEVIGLYPADIADWTRTRERLRTRLDLGPMTAQEVPTLRTTVASVCPDPWEASGLGWWETSNYQVCPGYYSDPLGKADLRYNIGSAWTHRVKNVGGRAWSHSPTFQDHAQTPIPRRTVQDSQGMWQQSPHYEAWRDERYRPIMSGRGRDHPPEPSNERVNELVRWMDHCDNANRYEATASPYTLAVHLFRKNQIRDAEAAVHLRFEASFRRRLDTAQHSFRDLQRRGHRADPVRAGFAIRGPKPHGKVIDDDARAGY